MDWLLQLDSRIFLAINGLHNESWDGIMWWISGKTTWWPFYVLVIGFLGWKRKWQLIPVVLFIIVVITLTDQTSVHLFKNVFQRPRPCHAIDLQLVVHTVEKCGGQFGFISSHAANSFALAFFISGLLRLRYSWLLWVMYTWAILTIYSRVYLGVHYPGDVIAGAMVGSLIGWVVLRSYQFTEKRLYRQNS